MNKDILLNNGYRRFKQPTDEPTLYQNKICDEKGIKYFINCYHYIFPEYSQLKNSWEFKLQIHSKLGTINITLFNSDLNIKKIEEFMKESWIHYGSNHYELFTSSENKENSQDKNIEGSDSGSKGYAKSALVTSQSNDEKSSISQCESAEDSPDGLSKNLEDLKCHK